MKSIELYAKGVFHTFETLFKGKFLIFFVPGFIAGIILLMYYAQTQGIRDAASDTANIPWVGGIIHWFASSIGDLLDFIVEQTFQFVVLVCFSPFNCILAEKYDNYLTGNKFDGGFLRILNDVLRAMFIIVIALFMEYTILIGWFLLSFFIPFDDVLTPIINFIVPAFFIGFALFDYALERYNVGTLSSWGYGFKRMLTMIIGGSLFVLIMKIPYLGIILAPVIATMVTTYVYVHRENKKQIINSNLLDGQVVQEIE